MPTYSITAPNGRTYTMPGPAGLTENDVIDHILKFDPTAGTAPPPPKTGWGASLQSGLESLISSGKAGFKGVTGDAVGAAQEGLEAQQEQQRKYDPQLGLDRVGKAYDKDGLWGATKEVVGQAPRFIAQSLPEMGTTMAGAATGARLGALVGGLPGAAIGGIGGGILAGILPHTGRNLVQQQQTTPGRVDVAPALAAGAAQAGLETAGQALFMGARVAGKVFGNDMAALVAKIGPEAAEDIAKRRLMATVGRGGAIGAAGESTTEVLQQALERLQAGKDLLDEEALKEYGEAAYGGALAGGPLGAAGHAYDRAGAQAEVMQRRRAAEALAEKQVAEERAAKEQADAEALARQKADPAYATAKVAEYAAYELAKKKMKARIAELGAEDTDAGNQAALDLAKELKAFEASSAPLIAEYNKYGRPLAEQLKRQAADAQALADAKARGDAPAPVFTQQDAAFQLPADQVSPAKRARIEQLKAIVAQHDEMLPKAREELIRIANGEYMSQQTPLSEMTKRAQAGLKQREKQREGALKELQHLDPEYAKQQTEAQAAKDKAEQLERDMAGFDPAKARKDIERLTPKAGGVSSVDQVQGAMANRAKIEKLESLLAEHAKRQAAPPAEQAPAYAEDLFDVDKRVGSEDEQRAQRAQEWDATGETEALHGYAPPEGDPEDQARFTREVNVMGRRQRRIAMNEAFNEAFAPTTRSAIVDVASQGQEAADGQATEGDAIAQRLASMVDDEKFDNAKLLQAHGAKVKTALYAGLKAARAARKPGDSPARVESFLEAIRKIAALEKIENDEIGPGRAHYRPEFYNIAAPLVPEVVQGARRILGMSAAKAGAGTAHRGQKLHDATMAREEARLEGVADPALTAAMEADLEGGATPTKPPETGKRHAVPKGTGPRYEAPGEDAEGQGFLFKPDAPAAPVDPRVALRQRIDKLRITPRLRAQAKGLLERAADVLGPPGMPAPVSQRVLENITEMVERAERGVGFSASPTKKVSLTRAAPVEREVQGTGTLVGDDGELFPSTPTAKATEGPTGEAGKMQRKALVSQVGYLGTAARAAVKEANEAEKKAKADPTNTDRAYNAKAKAEKAKAAVERARAAEEAARPPEQQGKLPVARQKLEMEVIGDAGRDEAAQAELPGMDELLNFETKVIPYSVAEIKANPLLLKLARAWMRRTGMKQLPYSLEAIERDPELRHFVKDYSHQRTGEVSKAGPLYVGRATPANFQRALDTGALPSTKRIGKEIKKTIEGLLTAGAMLRHKAAGLRTRVVDAGVAQERLRQVSQVLRSHDPKVIAAATERTRVELMQATNRGLKAAADSAKHAESAREASDLLQAATASERPAAEKLQRQHAGRAVRAAQAAVRQEERIEHLRGVLRAFADADAAPALEAKAQQIVALRTEQSDVAAEIARNDADLKARQGEAQKLQKQARTAIDIAAPHTERTQPSKLPTRQPLSAHVPTEAEKARTAANRSGTEYTELTGAEARAYEAKEKPVEALQIEGVLADAADVALEVPGVKQSDLDEIVARVSKYDTERAFTTRPGVVRNELAAVESEMAAMDRKYPDGVIPAKDRVEYNNTVLHRQKLTEQYMAARSSAERAQLQGQIDLAEVLISAANEKRTPLAKDKRYLDLKTKQALLEFERDAIDTRRAQIRIDENAPAKAKVKVAKRKQKPGKVEPATQLVTGEINELTGKDDAITRMDAKALTNQQKTRYQGKAVPPTPTMEKAAVARKELGVAIDTALKAERKKGPLAPGQAKAIADRIKAERTPAPQTAADRAAAAGRSMVERPLTQAEKRAEQAVRRAQNAKERAQEQQNAAAMEAEGGRTVEKLAVPAGDVALKPDTLGDLFEEIGLGNLDMALEALETDGSTPLMRELARKLRPLVKDTGLLYKADLKAVGSFRAGTNAITLGAQGLTENTLLHEAVHAATLRALVVPESEITRDQRNARKGLEGLLKQLQKDPAFDNSYGAVSPAELAAEIMTNQKLREKIDAKKPGFIRRFINAVLQMFGVKPQSLSAKAMAEVERLFEPSREFTDAELDAARAAKERSMPRIEAFKATQAAAREAREAQTAKEERARKLLKMVFDPDEDGTTVERIAASDPMGEFSDMNTAAASPRGVAGAKAMVTDINAGLAAEMAFVDQRAPIMKAMSKASQQVYQQARYFLLKADARMAQVYAVLMNGPAHLKRDAKGNHIVGTGNGPSAKELFELIGKLPGDTAEQKFALAQSYMVARRAANKGWETLGWETGAAKRAAAERGLAQVNANPALKAQLDAVTKMYGDYNKGMVQFLADSGAIPRAKAATLLQDNDYVPFYRVSGSGAAELVMGEGTNIHVGDVRRQPYLQKLVGDEGKLMPLNEAIMRNTMLLTDMGLTNLATKNIAYALQDMSKPPPGATDDEKKNAPNRIRSGKAPAGADIIKFNQEPEADNADDTGERWMRITSEGTPFEGIPAEMLVKSLEGSHLMLNGITKLGAKFGDVLRKGVTRSPMYILRQLIRDPLSASFTAGTSRGPVAAMFETMREFVSQTRGTSKTAETLLRSGITQSGVFTGDADDLNQFALQLAQGDQGAIARLAAMADRAAMRADAATRVQVYEDAMKSAGSEMQAEIAAMEMMNFTKRGNHPSVQQAARLIPFMSAQIQGLNVLYKAARGQMPMEEALQIRAKFKRRAMGLAAMSFVYAMGMEENEEYKNATAQDRFSNFFIPTPMGTIRVPIPYEVGLLFKVLPEALARGMSQGLDETDWAAMRKLGYNAIPGAGSYGIPQAAKPVIELAMNSNIYTGKPIESEAQQRLDPSERYNEGTTELMKTLGSATGLSPLKLEHLVRGYLGGLPLGVASLTNEVFADKETPDRRLSQTPIFGGLIADPLARGAVDRAYAKANAIKQAGATYDKLKKDGKMAAAEKYREDNINVLMAEPINDNFNRFMAGLRKQRAMVMQSGLSGAELRKQLDHLDAVQNERSDLFVKAVKSSVTAH